MRSFIIIKSGVLFIHVIEVKGDSSSPPGRLSGPPLRRCVESSGPPLIVLRSPRSPSPDARTPLTRVLAQRIIFGIEHSTISNVAPITTKVIDAASPRPNESGS